MKIFHLCWILPLLLDLSPVLENESIAKSEKLKHWRSPERFSIKYWWSKSIKTLELAIGGSLNVLKFWVMMGAGVRGWLKIDDVVTGMLLSLLLLFPKALLADGSFPFKLFHIELFPLAKGEAVVVWMFGVKIWFVWVWCWKLFVIVAMRGVSNEFCRMLPPKGDDDGLIGRNICGDGWGEGVACKVSR